MSQILSGLPGALGGKTGQGIGDILKLVMGGSGILGNLLQSRSAANRQAMLDSLAKNPAKLAALINSAKQPLSQGLVQGVTNNAQAQLAERGLSSSPQIATAVESQALAPYELKAGEDAQSAVMSALGLDVAGPSALPGGPSDTSSLWKLFQPQPGGGSSGAGGGISSYPSTPGGDFQWPDNLPVGSDFPSGGYSTGGVD